MMAAARGGFGVSRKRLGSRQSQSSGRSAMKICPSACSGDIVEIKRALALLGAHLPKREQPRQPAIGCPVARQAHEARAILQVEARADDELEPHLLGRDVRAHDARKRIAIGDGDRVEAQRLRLRDELLAVGGAAQEREVGRDLQLGIAPPPLEYLAERHDDAGREDEHAAHADGQLLT